MKTIMSALLSCVLCLVSLGGERPIVCFGDSVTACTRPPLGACPIPENETYVARTAAALSRTVINSGLSGATTEESLSRFETEVLAHAPSVVVVMFGLNDEYKGVTVERYIENLSSFAMRSRRIRAQVILMTPNPTRDAERNLRLKPYVDALREFAKRKKIRLVDNYATFCELNAEGDTIESLTYDAIHPNSQGQQVIASQLVKVLSKP